MPLLSLLLLLLFDPLLHLLLLVRLQPQQPPLLHPCCILFTLCQPLLLELEGPSLQHVLSSPQVIIHALQGEVVVVVVFGGGGALSVACWFLPLKAS